MKLLPAVSMILPPVALLVATTGHGEMPPSGSVIAGIEARHEVAVALLEDLVNINSGTMNFDGVRAVARRLEPELDALGFETRWVPGAAFGRAGHLLGSRGERGPRVLLIGHIDTVFEPDSPFQRFERVEDDRVRGPGVTDMKGGIVVLLEALRALEQARLIDGFRFDIVLHGDEEDAGEPLELARRDLIAAGRDADLAIGFEDGDGRLETAVIARRGASGWRLTTTGRPAHSSQIFTSAVGAGAIYEMARILTGFHDGLAGEDLVTFNPGVILGGTQVDFDPVELRGSASGKTNIVAQHGVVSGDLRTLTPESLVHARSTMQQIAAQNLPGTTAQLEFDDGYPPMAPTPGNRALLTQLDAASRELGFGPVTAVDPRDAGAADVSFVAGEVARIIDGVGLMGTGGHTVEETAELGSLTPQAARVAWLLARLADDPAHN
jgi:glutamate carboxypeptidase